MRLKSIKIMTRNVKSKATAIKKRVSPGKLRHGGYSYISKGVMPSDKKYVERYLTQMRDAYIRDLGPTEDDLSSGQAILLNKLVTMEGLTRCMEIQAARKESLNLPQNHSTYVNLILKICVILGIERREASDSEPTLQDIIEGYDRRAEEAKREKASERPESPSGEELEAMTDEELEEEIERVKEESSK